VLVANDLNGKLIMVRISNGAQTVAASGGNIVRTEGIALDFDGRVLVVDLESKKLIAVNLTSGVQQVIASGIQGTPFGLALDGLGNAYVGNYQSSTSGLTKIDLFTGTKTVLTTSLMTVFTIALFPAERRTDRRPLRPRRSRERRPAGRRPSLWSAVPEALTYRLYRDGQPIVTVPAAGTSYVDSPTLGTYNYCIEAVNFGGPSPGSATWGRGAPIVQPRDPHRPRRAQRPGREDRARVAAQRAGLDIGGTVTGYRIWRRLPFSESAQGPGFAGPGAAARRVESGQQVTFWEPLTTLPSAALEGYGVVVATTQDSLADSNPYTAFFVSALTSDPHVFYDSAVDSGYSADNLAPLEPSGLHGRSIRSRASRSTGCRIAKRTSRTTISIAA